VNCSPTVVDTAVRDDLGVGPDASTDHPSAPRLARRVLVDSEMTHALFSPLTIDRWADDAQPKVVPAGISELPARYVIEELLGQGGMGAVYRCFDRHGHQRVAIKVLAPEHQVDHDIVRFSRECDLLAALDHPAVVLYLDRGCTRDGRPFMVQEWIDGESLAHVHATIGLDLSEAVAVVRRVAQGLGAAHARGIVHRDIKPSNVMLRHGRFDRAVIVDFGLARLEQDHEGPTITGTFLGTPGYVAPEQASGDLKVTPATDVFALGCVLYELITSQPAFPDCEREGAGLWIEPIPVDRGRPDVPPALARIVECALREDPRARFADARALADALAAIGPLPAGGKLRAAELPPLHGARDLRIELQDDVAIVMWWSEDDDEPRRRATMPILRPHHRRADLAPRVRATLVGMGPLPHAG
jgi:serine/threonine protein kinase